MVTDNEAAADMLRVLVVDQTVDSDECLERLAELRPDAILLDAILPVLDGFETCARLQDLPGTRDRPVLMITVRENGEVFERAFASGVRDITERKQAEEKLRRAKQELEAHVAERTAELHHANEQLRIELANRQRAQAQLAHDALHDALSGLPNRTLFLDRLQQAMEHARRHPDYTFAVLFLDLDRFKTINDSLGHMIGDKLLVETARRLLTCVRPSDTVARLGGDEFAILLDEVGVVRGATQVVARIHAALGRPSVFEGHQIVVNTSIGIAFYEPGYTHPDEILRDADIAMYRAKSQGKAGYEIFRPEMHSRAVEELRLEAELRNAIEQHQFVLYYQPIITAMSGRITHVEALLRWQHPQRGLIGPAEFMHAADEAGLMVLIGEWVLRTGCAQVRVWQQAGMPELSLSVNLTTRQFKHKDLSTMVARVLRETGLPARSLDLEMTEGSLMGDAEGTTTALEQLGALGVHLSLDNFGTGYSSLHYLKRFPLTTLKIDRSFVGQITTNPDDAGVATAIIAMAHRLNLNVVAEGVETEAQLDFLKPYQCDSVQGYFLSPPLSADAMAERLQEGQHHTSATSRPTKGIPKVRRSTNAAARSHDQPYPG